VVLLKYLLRSPLGASSSMVTGGY